MKFACSFFHYFQEGDVKQFLLILAVGKNVSHQSTKVFCTPRGATLREGDGGGTLVRSHFSKFLSALGRVFQIYVRSRSNF